MPLFCSFEDILLLDLSISCIHSVGSWYVFIDDLRYTGFVVRALPSRAIWDCRKALVPSRITSAWGWESSGTVIHIFAKTLPRLAKRKYKNKKKQVRCANDVNILYRMAIYLTCRPLSVQCWHYLFVTLFSNLTYSNAITMQLPPPILLLSKSDDTCKEETRPDW